MRTRRSSVLLATALVFQTLATNASAAVPLVKINDSLYQTEHCLFIIDTGSQFGFPDYNSVYSQANLASYLDILTTHFPGTYFSICYLAKNLTPDNVPIYTTRIYKATGIVTPGTLGAPQSFATLDYCRYNLGTGTVLPTALAVYGHELGHAWGARILGESGHWSSSDTIWCRMGAIYSDDGYVTVDRVYGTPTDGFKWRRVDNRQVAETQPYSDQELYLLGAEPTLPAYYRLNGPVYNSDHTMAYSSITTCDQAAVVSAHGVRNPDFRQSQKRFKVAFVYLARDLAEVQSVAPQLEPSANQFCAGETISATTFRGQLPYLCMTKYRASVDGLLADLDGNATPVLTVANSYVLSTDGTAAVNFNASDPDGPAPAVSIVPASANCAVSGGTVQISGLPSGVFFFTLKAEDAGGKKDFSHFVVEVQRPTSSVAIVTPPTDQAVTSGATALFAVAASGSPATFSYQWWRRPAGTSTWCAVANGNGFSGATTSSLNVTTTCAMDDDQFVCAVDNGSGDATSTPATLTVLETPPVITSQPANVSMGPGGGANFTVAVKGAPTTTGYFFYQWQRLAAGTGAWSDLAVSARYINATSAGLTVSGTSLAMDGDQFRCVIANSAGSVTSNTVTLNVTQAPTINTQPVSTTAAVGGSASFAVTATGTSPLTYQWYHYAATVPGGTAATLNLAGLQLSDAGTYYVVATNAGGAITSNYVTLIVSGGIGATIDTQPTNQTVTAGGSATFSVTAAGTAPFSYSWRRSTNGGTSWAIVNDDQTYSGATTATLTITGTTTAMNGDQFLCIASNSLQSGQSLAAFLTVNPGVIAPSLSTQPVDQSIVAGGSAYFSIIANGTAPFTYLWQRSADSGSSWSDLADTAKYSGVTTTALVVNGATVGMSGDWFRCVVSNSAASASSNAAVLTVTVLIIAPSITIPPADHTVIAGNNVIFTVAVSGSLPIAYQWQRSTNSGASWSPLSNNATCSGVATATLSIASASSVMSGDWFRCSVSNPSGSVITSPATLTVTALVTVPSVSTPPQDVSVANGASASFSVTATGTGPLLYQWLKNGSSIAGASNSSYTIASTQISDAGSYQVTIANSAGSVTSNNAVLTVIAAPPPASIANRLINISTRSLVGTGGDLQIAGFVIQGSGAKRVIIRASGPALAQFGVTGVLADPVLTLYSGQNVIAQNDDWNLAQAPDFASVGAYAWTAGSKDSALVVTLQPGIYTAHVSGKNSGIGVALIEVYDADGAAATSKLINISTRSLVGTDGDIQIGGFVVQGDTPKKFIIRACGPSLSTLGVAGVLSDPVLTLYSGQTVLLQNDDWNAALASDFAAVGAFAWSTGSKDAALGITLQPGMYTAHVSGKNGSSGVALIEVYEQN